ncbi:hypothetical protein [uncultured Enterovirga sp.]|uniref:hypothetical protein n=1 Tax=uncultured Enterovirga sp. TaxID=2026352 RepID=UPI0035CB10B9
MNLMMPNGELVPMDSPRAEGAHAGQKGVAPSENEVARAIWNDRFSGLADAEWERALRVARDFPDGKAAEQTRQIRSHARAVMALYGDREPVTILSAHLISWEHGQRGVALELSDGRSCALPVEGAGGEVAGEPKLEMSNDQRNALRSAPNGMSLVFQPLLNDIDTLRTTLAERDAQLAAEKARAEEALATVEQLRGERDAALRGKAIVDHINEARLSGPAVAVKDDILDVLRHVAGSGNAVARFDAPECKSLLAALVPSTAVAVTEPSDVQAVCDPNGRRWRVEGPDWTMQPEGIVSSDQAREICQTAAAALGTLAAQESGWRPRTSVVPDWFQELPLQQQSVLILALRGPDGVEKHHECKHLVRHYRATVLCAAKYGRWLQVGEAADSFMSMASMSSEAAWDEQVLNPFFDVIDCLPHHYVAHLSHGAEILGYKHPDLLVRGHWLRCYLRFCEDRHHPPETEEQMDTRLSDWNRRQWDAPPTAEPAR